MGEKKRDFNDVLREEGAAALGQAILAGLENFKASNDGGDYPKVDGAIVTRNEFFKEKFRAEQALFQKYSARTTGISTLDDKQIFAPGLYVLGGLPSVGKTAFAWQLADTLADNGEEVIYVTYEMTAMELFSRTLSRRVFEASDFRIKCPAAVIRRNLYGDSASVEVEKLIEKFSADYDGPAVYKVGIEKPAEVIAKLRKTVIPNSPTTIFIDYLQLAAVGSQQVRGAIDEFVRNLKIFQQETNATVICLSAFNRDNYNCVVGYESFKESGGIEYTADVVWGLQLAIVKELEKCDKKGEMREKHQAAKMASPRRMNLVCLKNRFGSLYEVDLNYYPDVDYFDCSPIQGKMEDENGRRKPIPR